MPDQNRDVTRYARYFNMNAPSSMAQAVLFFIIGIASGIAISLLIHSQNAANLPVFLISGASIGVIIITLPAVITVTSIKAMKRGILLRHALFAVLIVTAIYAALMIANAALFGLLNNYAIAYLVLILSNAAIYGYWFLINRVVMDQRRSQTITAAFHPLLNVLLYLPVGSYIFNIAVPVSSVLIKLWAGMLVFMSVGYLILYIMDRPAKKELNISGVTLLTAMVNQWLYDVIKDKELFKDAGVKRDINVGILALKGRRGYKAMFIMPDIHYGPFSEIGGSITTEHLGREIERKYGATPFIMHGAVNLEDNPVSVRQIREMSDSVIEHIEGFRAGHFKPTSGSISVGRSGPCRAINIGVGDTCILTLTKAPAVTEDIERSVGNRLARIANKRFKNVMLVDAHNSRLESENADELKGVYEGSKYIGQYESAINSAISRLDTNRRFRLRFGSASQRTSEALGRKDMGKGYTSVSIFEFNGERFCMLCFDANNMLPSLREAIISHVRDEFGIAAEVYTTDTHSVNTIALPASNVLGRETKPKELFPIIDSLINGAIKSIENVSHVYSDKRIKNFRVWGRGTEDILLKVSREVIRTGKRKVPIVIAAGFIIAAWAIYLI